MIDRLTTNNRRILVTGIGGVASLGPDARSIWERAKSGDGAIQITNIDPGPNGPEAHDVPLARVTAPDMAFAASQCNRQSAATLDSFAKLAVAASVEAVNDAGLSADTLNQRTAVIFGHGTGGTESFEASYERFFALKTPKAHPLTIPRVMLSSPTSAVAMHHNVHGVTFATSSACSSSGHAIVMGALLIATGLADAAIVGGSESLATSGFLRGWEAMQAMSSSTCRPFASERDGMVVGEGGAALVLQAADSIDEESAKPYAELVGFGCTSDSYHLTKPSLEGVTDSISHAIGDLDLASARILVSAHGTGTPLNDINEAQALRAVLGGRTDYRVTATKSLHGHLLGGSTALQAIIALQAMREGIAPAIANVSACDPDCDLPLVLDQAQPFDATHVLANSFAFGGLNVSLLFGKVLPRSARGQE
ncbi:MAG: beta-ketoacyl-[acyl-carrier-protein] synthase family protein [Novosphingobium sp.]